MPIDQTCQIAIALRPSDSSTAIISPYASQALTERFPSGSAGIAGGPKPMVTSMASFEYISGFEPSGALSSSTWLATIALSMKCCFLPSATLVRSISVPFRE